MPTVFIQLVMIAIYLLGSGIDQVSQHLIAVRQKTRQASEIFTLLFSLLLFSIKFEIVYKMPIHLIDQFSSVIWGKWHMCLHVKKTPKLLEYNYKL